MSGWSGDLCDIPSCTPSDRCGAHGHCNTKARGELNQCICDKHWSGATCATSDADVQDLFAVSSEVAFGIEVVNPFESYVQPVPLKDAAYVAAILAESRVNYRQLLIAWNGGLLSIADNSIYQVNPYTGTSTILPLGSKVASNGVAIALTEVFHVMCIIQYELYLHGRQITPHYNRISYIWFVAILYHHKRYIIWMPQRYMHLSHGVQTICGELLQVWLGYKTGYSSLIILD